MKSRCSICLSVHQSILHVSVTATGINVFRHVRKRNHFGWVATLYAQSRKKSLFSEFPSKSNHQCSEIVLTSSSLIAHRFGQTFDCELCVASSPGPISAFMPFISHIACLDTMLRSQYLKKRTRTLAEWTPYMTIAHKPMPYNSLGSQKHLTCSMSASYPTASSRVQPSQVLGTIR